MAKSVPQDIEYEAERKADGSVEIETDREDPKWKSVRTMAITTCVSSSILLGATGASLVFNRMITDAVAQSISIGGAVVFSIGFAVALVVALKARK